MTKRVVPQTDRPNRVVYRLTKSGRDELDRWLATPFVRPAYRNDLSLKLLAASRLGRSNRRLRAASVVSTEEPAHVPVYSN